MNMRIKSVFNLIFVAIILTQNFHCFVARTGINLSKYIKICHRNDPQLNKCMKESLEKLRPFLRIGIPELGIPPFEPLIIPEIIMNQGKGSRLNIQNTFKDLHMWGISQFELEDLHINLDKNQMRFRIFFPNLQTRAMYQITGNILMLPIVGSGIKEGNYTNIEGVVQIRGSKIQENESTFFHVDTVSINLDIGHVSVHYSNLFNGDKELGDAMNTFINDNWKHVMKDIKPVLEQTIEKVVKGLLNAIYDEFPLEEILPCPHAPFYLHQLCVGASKLVRVDAQLDVSASGVIVGEIIKLAQAEIGAI